MRGNTNPPSSTHHLLTIAEDGDITEAALPNQ